MFLRGVLTAAAASVALMSAGAADAAYVFAGSWRVDAGPAWDGAGPNGPLAYTAQEAAALLFGGVASDYVTSIQGQAVADIDNFAWYSILGSGIGVLDQDYNVKYLGQYYGPTADHDDGSFAVASAYVNDFAIGERYTNYAFRWIEDEAGGGIPEPATWALMIAGFGLAGAALRRRHRADLA